jgi:excisionase family DNA binding protein
MAEERLSTARELAGLLAIPVGTLYDRARKEGWPHYKVGHSLRFSRDEILGLLRDEGGPRGGP